MKVICPRCGKKGSLVYDKRDDKVYVYVWHYEGKGKRRKCYLGAREYRYVEFLNNILLRGMHDPLRFVDYAYASIRNLNLTGLEKHDLIVLREKLEKLKEEVEETIKAVEELLK